MKYNYSTLSKSIKSTLHFLAVYSFIHPFAASALVCGAGTIPDPAETTCILSDAAIPKFVNVMPVPKRIDVTAGASLNIEMNKTQQDLLGIGNLTNVWGYGPIGAVTYPGPTLVSMRNKPVNVTWYNNLPAGPHLLPVDMSLHMAKPLAPNAIPTVVHLHGSHVEADSDGYPEAWYTQNWSEKGPRFVKKTFTYDNTQESATLWYHDHTLGLTRLNVYAGLAGFNFLRDSNELTRIKNKQIPSGKYEVEVVIQDRMFTPNGQLFYPSEAPQDTLAPSPSMLPEFFGNVILVNGKAWPKFNVERRKYRFRMLNGSDSRFYHLTINKADGSLVPFTQIGTDQGFINVNTRLTDITIAPGERADLIIDFTNLAGQRLIIRNDGAEPFLTGVPTMPGATQIMAFDVASACTTSTTTITSYGYPTATTNACNDGIVIPTTYRVKNYAAPATVAKNQQLILAETTDEFGRVLPILGTVKEGQLLWHAPTTEKPKLGATEIWELYNTSVDVHAIHLHLVSFEVLSRNTYSALQDPQTNALSNIVIGQALPILATERGPRDVIQVAPGEVVKVKAVFDRPFDYVWHCHMLSHEDHDMMRPFTVVPGKLPNIFTSYLSSVHSGKCMDVAGLANYDGGNIWQWACTGGANQKVTFTAVTGKPDVYTLKFAHSGRCATVASSSLLDGGNIWQWGCKGGLNQQFKLADAGNGAYSLIAQHSAKVVDVSNVSKADGANIYQWTDRNGDNQKWNLIPTTTIFTKCAAEGGSCSFTGTKLVKYGAGSRWVYKRLSNGTTCNNSVFGDPYVGILKSCLVEP